MEHIERDRIYSDSAYRLQYVARFVNFGQDDIDAVKTVGKQLIPAIDAIVQSVYEKLFKYDITKRHFLYKNETYEGPTLDGGKVANSLEELTIDNPQIKMRMHFLNKYLNRLLSGEYDDRMFKYLDWVAKIHTDTPDKKSKINVDYIHINALMAVVEEILIAGVLSLKLEDKDLEKRAICGFNKVVWIQNDFYAKYYTKESVEYNRAHDGNGDKSGALSPLGQSITPFVIGAAAGVLAYFVMSAGCRT